MLLEGLSGFRNADDALTQTWIPQQSTVDDFDKVDFNFLIAVHVPHHDVELQSDPFQYCSDVVFEKGFRFSKGSVTKNFRLN